MKKFGFPRSSRMTRETDFRRIFESGSKTATRELVMWQRSSPSSRIGIVVSRKHGNSCSRNRLKRLIREAFRLNNRKLRKNSDMVICPRVGCKWGNLGDAENALLRIWKKAGICQDEQKNQN